MNQNNIERVKKTQSHAMKPKTLRVLKATWELSAGVVIIKVRSLQEYISNYKMVYAVCAKIRQGKGYH